MKICIVGMGNMGSAMFEALKGDYDVSGCDRDDEVADADVYVLAMKPQDFDGFDFGDKLVISIMAGVSLETIGAKNVVRAMPNLPLKVGAGLTGWFSQGDVDGKFVRELLEHFGKEIEVDSESKIDEITALAGSGPAYYYYLNKAIKKKALELGFSGEDACKIVKSTFLGAAKLLEKGDKCSCGLIKAITSKGGTTEAALEHFEEAGFDDVVAGAIDSAIKRAHELK